MVSRSRLFSAFAKSFSPVADGEPLEARITTEALDATITENLSESYIQYAYDGALSVQTGSIKLFAPDSYSCTEIVGRLSAAADANIDLVINKNGSQVDTLTIPSGNVDTSDSANITLIPGDYLTVDISTVGTTNKGTDLSISFKLEQ